MSNEDHTSAAESLEIPYSFAKKHGVLVMPAEDATIVYCVDSPKLETMMELNRRSQQSLRIEQLSRSDFDEKMRDTYERSSEESTNRMASNIGEEIDLERLAEDVPQTTDLLEASDEAPVIRLINALLTQAIRDQVSDIHLEAFEKQSVVRYRVDGVLKEILTVRRELHNSLISRLKVMSQLDIAEKRLPQDGRMSLRVGEFPVDVRISILPTQHGERAVLRLLDKQSARLDLKGLGFPADLLTRFIKMIGKPNGIILVTGPTGSGKTTTLYSGLQHLDRERLNVLTVEDPIEYDLSGIGQTQINNKVGLSFASGLRSILRQDPDVVLVGEIRDLETAQISVQASLTGHLVLSTLHTNTAIGAVTRLVDMGVEPFLLASSMVGLLAQRLVRKICPSCCSTRIPSDSEIRLFKLNGLGDIGELPLAKGCADCDQNGYRGRMGIYELVEIDEKLRRMIHDQISEHEMAEYAHARSHSLLVAGLHTVIAGSTTVEEVMRVTQEAQNQDDILID